MALLRAVYYRSYRIYVRLWCAVVDVFERPSATLPPAMLRFRVGETTSVERFRAIGERCAELIVDTLKLSGIDPRSCSKILDFGCGCGRTLAWIEREFLSSELFGVDVDEEAIEWCTRNLLRVKTETIGFRPPLHFSADTFDVIYCISVFTHLDHTAQDEWLSEMLRLLKPGGILILTVHGNMARRVLTESDHLELVRSGILHRRSQKLTGIVPPNYHTTWHTEAYVTAKFQSLFERVSYREIQDGMQDVIAGIKPCASKVMK